MDDFYTKTEYSVDDINGLIETSAEESIEKQFGTFLFRDGKRFGCQTRC